MLEFLLKKDQWKLDLFSSICFALVMSALFQIGGDSGQKYLDRILIAMLLGALAYLVPAVLAVFLRKRLEFIKSWAWLGVGGALLKVFSLAYTPKNWDYYLRTSATTDLALKKFLLGGYSGLIVPWIFWILLGCTCIFAVRLIAYFVVGRNRNG